MVASSSSNPNPNESIYLILTVASEFLLLSLCFFSSLAI